MWMFHSYGKRRNNSCSYGYFHKSRTGVKNSVAGQEHWLVNFTGVPVETLEKIINPKFHIKSSYFLTSAH